MDFRMTNVDGLGNMFAISGPSTKGSALQDDASASIDASDIFEVEVNEGEPREGAAYRFEDEQGRERFLEVVAVSSQVVEGRTVTRVRARWVDRPA